MTSRTVFAGLAGAVGALFLASLLAGYSAGDRGRALITGKGEAVALIMRNSCGSGRGQPRIGGAALRLRLVIGVAASVCAATAVAGIIGFVGLVVPLLLRRSVGSRAGLLMPASAHGGVALVLAANTAVRLILPDRDLKLGVLMVILGAPLFLHLI